MQVKLSLLLMCSICAMGSIAKADLVTNIVSWDLTGQAGNQDSSTPSATAAHITGIAITRGAGLTPFTIPNTFSSSGWESPAALDPALDTEYVSFGFTVAPGYQVDLNNALVTSRSNPGGPGTLGLYYNGNNFSSPLYTFIQPETTELQSDIPLTQLTGLTGTIEFRIIEIGNTSNDSAAATDGSEPFRLAKYMDNAVQFNGTVTAAVPEPSAFLYGGLVCSVLGLISSRKFFTAKDTESL